MKASPIDKNSEARRSRQAGSLLMSLWAGLAVCAILAGCGPAVKLKATRATAEFENATAPVATEVVIAKATPTATAAAQPATATFAGDLVGGTKHYQNQDYGISFDYPAAWEPYSRQDALAVGANVPDNMIIGVTRPGSKLNIRMAISVESGGPDRFSEAQYRSYASQLDQASPGAVSKFQKVSDQIITIGGVNALEYIFKYDPLLGTGLDEIRQISVVRKGYAFTLSCGAPVDVFDSVNKDVFNLILKSFKFE